MSGFKTVLLPTDFHHDDARALEYAWSLTGDDGRTVILHVGDREASTPAGRTAAETMELLLAKARPHGMRVEGQFRTGDFFPEIIAAIKENRADVVIVSASRRTMVDRLIIPSHYNDLVRKAPVPVMAVTTPPPEESERLCVPHVKRIMCPQDETDFARAALPLAAQLAAHYGAELFMVNVSDRVKPDDRAGRRG
ncbi:MAG: universal stress protein, partial [Candidatus Hydrogenedentales bacterium]